MAKKQRFKDIFVVVPFSIVLSGIGIFLCQSYLWLEHGYWKSLRACLVIDRILPPSFFLWLKNEGYKYNLHKIVAYISNSSLAVFLIISGLVLIVLIEKISSLFSRLAMTQDETTSWRS